MSLRRLFHKIKIGFIRMRANTLPPVSSTEIYGINGENQFVRLMKKALPTCRIKQNIVIDSPDGNAEIDCLILYNNKIFAIEVKRWKGRLIENDNGFVQEKTDRWTGEKHIKRQRSPFKQLNRAVYLLKRTLPSSVWVNDVVFFEDDEFDGIETQSDGIWFNDIDQLSQYIINNGKVSPCIAAQEFFKKCVSSDCLYSKDRNKILRCVIHDDSLKFNIVNEEITREQIRYININHHWSYDDLNITLKDGTTRCVAIENAKVIVTVNDVVYSYGMSKLRCIELG